MRIPFLTRLMEIKELQLQMELQRTMTLIDILQELRRGLKDGKNKSKVRKSKNN